MYIDAVKGGIISIILFTILSIFVNGVGPSEEITMVITISTFIFAILSGFFISRLNERHNNIRTLMTQEDALLLSFYKTASLYEKKFSNHIRDLIEKYYITVSNHSISETHYKQTRIYFLKMYDALKTRMTHKNSSPMSWMLEILTTLEQARNALSVRLKSKLRLSSWLILVALTIVIIFSLFYSQGNTITYKILNTLLSSALVVVLLIIRDYGNMESLDKFALNESEQEVLEDIGKERYYNIKFYNTYMHLIPNNIKSFRVGFQKKDGSYDIKKIQS